MIYKLLHKIFGWDYIHWENVADYDVARVHKSQDGTVWYWRYKSTNCIDRIDNPKQVVWLTCHPDKYFKEK